MVACCCSSFLKFCIVVLLLGWSPRWTLISFSRLCLIFKIAFYKLTYASFHPFVDSLLLDAYKLFGSRSLRLCWPGVFHWRKIRIPKWQNNIKHINSKSTFMSEIRWFLCWFSNQGDISLKSWRELLDKFNHSRSRSIMKTFLTELGVIVTISPFFCKAQDQDSANYCISICSLDLRISFCCWKTRMYTFIYTVRCIMKVRENKR